MSVDNVPRSCVTFQNRQLNTLDVLRTLSNNQRQSALERVRKVSSVVRSLTCSGEIYRECTASCFVFAVSSRFHRGADAQRG